MMVGQGRGQETEEATQISFLEQPGMVHFIPFLQAQGDDLIKMMSFDWGLHFFRNRGRQGNYSRLIINGLLMNSLLEGTIPWKEIAGLNEQFRNRQLLRPEDIQDFGPPALVETQLIELSPFNNRLQTKFVLSSANRFYRFRFGISSTQQSLNKAHRFTVSLTNRSGGILAPLRSISYLAGWGHRPDENREWGIYLMGVHSQRGKNSPQTKEVYSLTGHDYNPNGGFWKGQYKSSRLEIFHRPLVLGYFKKETPHSKYLISSAYQQGKQTNIRLGFRDAPHPNPSYYKYLPSYYRTKALGKRSDLLEIEHYFNSRPQLDWLRLYRANQENNAAPAHYALLGDSEQLSRLMTTFGFWRFGKKAQLYTGLSFSSERTLFFQTPVDLLGGGHWVNQDVFSRLSYDVESALEKKRGDITHHHYTLAARQLELSGHFMQRKDHFLIQLGGRIHFQSGRRRGLLKNELYPNGSLGKSERADALGFGGFLLSTWNIHLRQQVVLSLNYQRQPRPMGEHFVEPEFSNQSLRAPSLIAQKAISLEMRRRQPQWNARLTFFANEVSGEVASRSSYVETAFGEGLFTESVYNLQSLSTGIEGYLKWKVNDQFNIDLGWQFRRDYWVNKPKLLWRERPGLEASRVFSEGVYAAGELNVKGLHRGVGPEKALGVRVNYRSPEYWWVQSGIHSFWGNYISPALNRYSDTYFLAPGGSETLALSPERKALLRQQEELPAVGYLHIAGGKSWKRGKRFTSLFISLQNILGAQLPTGGFQQNRVAHAQLALEERNSSTPLFPNKYWMGSGRTFFLNLSTSF